MGESGGGATHHSCCCMCGRDPSSSSSSSTEFQKFRNYYPFVGDGRVVESFRASPTLKKTLEILSTGTATAKDSGPLFDKSYVYRLLTSPEGGPCCFNCSVVLHKGLETAAEILHLETYLKNLGRDIVLLLHASRSKSSFSQSSFNSRFHRIKVNSSSSSFAENGSNNNRHDIFSRFRPVKEEASLIPEDLVDVKIESIDGKEQQASVNLVSSGEMQSSTIKITESTTSASASVTSRTLRQRKPPSPPKNSDEDEPKSKRPTNSTIVTEREKKISPTSISKRSSNSNSTRTRKKEANAKSTRCTNKFPPGVKQCPSCAFSVDVRSVSQRSSPPSSLTRSTREVLRKKAIRNITSHFLISHMPPGAKKKFKTKPNRSKLYLCYDSRCSYSAPIYFHVVMHYMRMHTREIVAPEDLDRLTCPEDESCSFEAHAKRKPDGTRVNNTFRYAKNSIAAHVFKEHDIPSHPSLQIVESKVNKLCLFAKTDSDSRKAYRCTRCDYFDLIPEKLNSLEYKDYRYAFLKHFYDAHLQK